MTTINCGAFWCRFADGGICERDEVKLIEQNLSGDKRFSPACISMKPHAAKVGDEEAEAVMRKKLEEKDEDS